MPSSKVCYFQYLANTVNICYILPLAAELQRQKIEENARVIHAQETAAERDDEPDNEEIHGGPQGEGNLDADAPPPKKKTKMDDASLGLESGGQVFHLKEDIMADGTVEINIDGRRFRKSASFKRLPSHLTFISRYAPTRRRGTGR